MLTNLRTSGRALATKLSRLRAEDPIVIAIPHRGVVVGAEIAQRLRATLDVLLVAKVFAPERDRAIGAVTLGGARAVDEGAIAAAGLSSAAIERLFARAHAALSARLAAVRGDPPMLELRDRLVILVDDAVVTGLTMTAALGELAVRKVGAIVVATALCGDRAAHRLRPGVREWIALERALEADVEVRHLEASTRICPPVSDDEIRRLIMESWRVRHQSTGGLEIDGL